ncbi:MAG: aminotransferase [Alphaproteobacteria bacterium]|jgi:aspartate/methionine/tyrosine aminotransferase|nr:aminotransferase [Alphaproteobacteria bacterium]
MRWHPRTADTFASPIVETQAWMRQVQLPADMPLLNVAQAAPTDPPPEGLRRAIAEAAMEDNAAHLYGEVLGLRALREEVAQQFSGAYGGALGAENVAITSGCNQAFAAAIAGLCGQGDQVILPCPWYFNHAMWLDMMGVETLPLSTGADLLPDSDRAEALITDRTRAIVLVSPNNPGGVEYPPALMRAFFELARRRGLKLIVDETYRDFDSRGGPPHDLLADPDWDDTLIQLYSFSKAYRLTGHRVGAMVGAPGLLKQIEKFLDTVTICPNQLGQRAALWGMRNLAQWLAAERAEILARRDAIVAGFPTLAGRGWRLRGCGAYFAYVDHPFEGSSLNIAPQMLARAGVLILPGTFFMPAGAETGRRAFRIAFANVDRAGISTLFERLAAFRPA